MVHRLSFSDVLLLFPSANLLHSEAVVRETLGKEGAAPSLAGAYLRQWLPARWQQRTWVYIEGRRARGILSARGRYGSGAWEVVHLALPEERENCLALLDGLKLLGRKERVTRVFLRLPWDSPSLPIVQSAGFSPYLKEKLYLLGGGVPQQRGVSSPFIVHRRGKSDDYSLFQLYSSSVPAPVRQAEGMTFEDWRQCWEGGGRGGGEWVGGREGSLLGWFRISPRRGVPLLELMATPAAPIEDFLELAIARAGGYSILLCLAAEHQEKLQQLLLARGFQPVAEYSSMVKLLAQPVSQTVLAPLRA